MRVNLNTMKAYGLIQSNIIIIIIMVYFFLIKINIEMSFGSVRLISYLTVLTSFSLLLAYFFNHTFELIKHYFFRNFILSICFVCFLYQINASKHLFGFD